MMDLLRLIRLPNLIIIILTMAGVRYGIFMTLWGDAVEAMKSKGFAVEGLHLHMKGQDFFLLMLAMLCIAAGGNIINDYFDTKTDRANKPERVVVGRTIKRRVAMALHFVLNIIGLAIGFKLCYAILSFKLFGIFVFGVVALWFYSTHFKKQLLSGNIIISLLVALVPITVAMFEFSSNALYDLNILNMHVNGLGNEILRKGAFIIIGYSVFAFLTNLIREIVKDMEDVEGDLLIGAKTVPIVLGEMYTKYLVLALAVFTGVLLSVVQQYLWLNSNYLMFWFLMLAVQAPLLAFILTLWKAWQKKHYSKASLFSKLVITGGVLSMFLFPWM